MGAQEGTQTLKERIAAALEAHRPYGLDCKCGTAINSDSWWAAHATSALVEALGLEPELLYLNLYAARNGAAPEIQQRFVTPWEDV